MFMTIGSNRYMGSATLIDMKCAITAGHCVHGGKGSTWARNVVVNPRWDGDANQYGNANGVRLLTWTAWANNSDFNHDMGAIQLDRPVGYLTGWLGYGYNTNNNYYRTTTFNVAGYPGRYYSGSPNALYYGYGTFDNVYTYRLYAKTNWPYRIGGMSGSGFYVITSSGRIVHGVMSTASYPWNPGRTIGVTRMTSSKFSYIKNSFIPGAYSKTKIDLVPLEVRCSPTSGIRPGYPLSSMSYKVVNASLYNPGTARYYVDVYLSTNDNISKADRKIQRHSFTWNFGAKAGVRVNVSSPPYIPSNTTAGYYWIGVIIDVNDADTSNNDSDGWDAQKIKVLPPYPVAPYGFGTKEGNSYMWVPSKYGNSRGQFIFTKNLTTALGTGYIKGLSLRRDGMLSGTFAAHSFPTKIYMASRGVPGQISWSLSRYSANRGYDFTLVRSLVNVNYPGLAKPAVPPDYFKVYIPFSRYFYYRYGRNLLVQFDVNPPRRVYNWYADAQEYSVNPGNHSARKYGRGCPSGRYLTGSAPDIYPGMKVTWRWNSGASNKPGVEIIGFSKTYWSGFHLPLSLAPYGAPGCYLNTGLVYTFPGVTNSGGYFQGSATVPYSVYLAGARFYSQSLVIDPRYNSLGLRASEGLEYKLGSFITGPALALYSYMKSAITDVPEFFRFKALILEFRQ